MLRYFRIRKPREDKNRKRQSELNLYSKKYKFTKKRDIKYVAKSKNILILGSVGSGKTKEINRLFENKEIVWTKYKKFVWLDCNISLSDWIQLVEQNTKKSNLDLENIEDLEELEIKGLYGKTKTLIEYATNSIIFVDDIHKATGRKLEVLKDILRVCKKWIVSASSKHHINKTLLKNMKVQNKDTFFKTELTTTQAIDGTNILFVIFILSLLITGNVELALLVTAGRLVLKQSTVK